MRADFDPTIVIAVDFDGTITKVDGGTLDAENVNQEAKTFINYARSKGAYVILWTCRERERLDEAIRYCANHGIFFDNYNEDNGQREQSRKPNVDMLIDNLATPSGAIDWQGFTQRFEAILKNRRQ